MALFSLSKKVFAFLFFAISTRKLVDRAPRFLVLLVFVLRVLATAMLSTRFGYLRPAARARDLAALVCFGESDVRRLFGFLRFHGGRDSER